MGDKTPEKESDVCTVTIEASGADISRINTYLGTNNIEHKQENEIKLHAIISGILTAKEQGNKIILMGGMNVHIHESDRGVERKHPQNKYEWRDGFTTE